MTVFKITTNNGQFWFCECDNMVRVGSFGDVVGVTISRNVKSEEVEKGYERGN